MPYLGLNIIIGKCVLRNYYIRRDICPNVFEDYVVFLHDI